jgi:type I restriction enzyme S subunit
MKTPWFVDRMTSMLRGIGGTDQGNARTPRINPRDLGGIEVELPSVAEQSQIVENLQLRLGGVDALLVKANEMVAVLREYRSALITDAVTGKIDVREKA